MGDLEAITRMEKIIAGEDLKPETRLEMFLKEYSGGGGDTPSGIDLSKQSNWDFFELTYSDSKTIDYGNIYMARADINKTSFNCSGRKLIIQGVQVTGYTEDDEFSTQLISSVEFVHEDSTNLLTVYFNIHSEFINRTFVRYVAKFKCYSPKAGTSGGGGSASALNDVNITNLSNNDVLIYDSTSQKWKNVQPQSYKEVTGTLTAGSTSLTLSDASITSNSTYDIYTNVYGVNPTDVTLENGSITMTFEAQQSDIGVKVRVS